MANINWSRHSYGSRMDSPYYANPKTGFDKAWHDKQRKLKKKRKAQQKAKTKATTEANMATIRQKILDIRLARQQT